MKATDERFVTVEFTRDYKCYSSGTVRDVTPHFAYSLIEHGVAKRVIVSKKDKQQKTPPVAKMI